MRKPYVYLVALFIPFAGRNVRATAGGQRCYGSGDSTNLDLSDPNVVRGDGLFQRGATPRD